MTVFQKVDFGIIKEKSDSLWNLIVSPLESAISYKFLMFQKIPYRERPFRRFFYILLLVYYLSGMESTCVANGSYETL